MIDIVHNARVISAPRAFLPEEPTGALTVVLEEVPSEAMTELANLASGDAPIDIVETSPRNSVKLTGSSEALAHFAARCFRCEPTRSVCEALDEAVVAFSRWHWTLDCLGRQIDAGPRPLVMGIVNTTPDSFSDGGQFSSPDEAIEFGLGLVADGADLLDIGGESTRPDAEEVPADEEISRVVPVIRGLAEHTDVPMSIDTRKARVAKAALDAGASIVNDISTLADPDMAPLVARAGCPIIIMHMQGTPQTMQDHPHYEDVVADVCRDLRTALLKAEKAGVDLAQTIVDPGIGFGKTVEHNLELLRRAAELRTLGRPVMIGTSRKSFLGAILNTEPGDRLEGTLASCVWTRAQGAAIFRVHDIRPVARALKVTAAMETGRQP